MIVRKLGDLAGTERHTRADTWESRRFLLAKDGMGFSLHDTIIFGGTETPMWYRHHLEAVYCIEGEGELEVLPDGPVHPVRPGTLYALDGHERHVLRATTRMRMVCVFNPPCTGQEVHGPDGAYPPSMAGPDEVE
jgi:L-ectoine synthase